MSTLPMSRVMGTYCESERSMWGRVPTNYMNRLVTFAGKILLVGPRLALLAIWNPLAMMMMTCCGLVHDSVFKFSIWVWIRGNLLIFGFWWISTKGKKRLPADDASCVIVCNHVSWMEAAFIMAEFAPSFVAKSSIRRMPIVGAIGEKIQCIWIDRLGGGGGGGGDFAHL